MASTIDHLRMKIKEKKAKRRQQWADSKKAKYQARARVLCDTNNAETLRKRRLRAAKSAKRAKQLEYTTKCRQKKKTVPCIPDHTPRIPFRNRMDKSSDSSSGLESDTLETINSFIQTVKRRRSDEARTTLKVIKCSVSGENIAKYGAATNLANKLGIKPAAIRGGIRTRTEILNTKDSAFEYTKRKTRCDTISQEVKAKVFDFWLLDGNSRPANNKTDVKRVRLGPKSYSSHSCYILEKTQTEVYQQFLLENPDVRIGQRAFESCKPFFVRPASTKDKVTCCCRQHLEARALFRTCSLYQRKVLSEKRVENVHIFESLVDLCNATLCPPSANTHQYKLSCLNRQCPNCGIDKINILPADFDEDQDTVKWERYEYQNIKVKGNTVRKLVLVKKRTSPQQMFKYFLELLDTFPAHQFRAWWQTKQLKHLIETLPLENCLAIHDFSENYKCCERNEIQSSYFQKTEVSLHVTVLHRHAVLEVDGVDSTAENPSIVSEHFFVISPDQAHDHHFTNTVQRLISDYLHSINCSAVVMHEFTDGCSSQYKSRHCLGDISYAHHDFGYDKLIRNYFETSHGRGPQDAAGGFVKRQADMAVLRGNEIIQNAQQFYEFAEENLEGTACSAKCSRRIFRYVETINRQRDRYFHPIKNNRKIHQACVVGEGELVCRQLSCYCRSCITGNYNTCLNTDTVGMSTTMVMTKQAHVIKDDDNTLGTCNSETDAIYDLVNPGAIVALRVDDDRYPYYLMKVSCSPFICKHDVKDAWGASYTTGTSVIKGHYFDNVEGSLLRFRLLRRLPAISPTLAIIYICSEVDLAQDSILTISDSLHRRLLKAVG